MLSGTLRELIERRVCTGRVEVDGNVEVFEGGRHKRVRQGWGRGPVCRKGSDHRKNGLTEPGTRSECAGGSKAH